MIDRKFFVDKGNKGGSKTLKKYGKAHFKRISKLAHEAKRKILKASIKRMKELPECAETPNNL